MKKFLIKLLPIFIAEWLAPYISTKDSIGRYVYYRLYDADKPLQGAGILIRTTTDTPPVKLVEKLTIQEIDEQIRITEELIDYHKREKEYGRVMTMSGDCRNEVIASLFCKHHNLKILKNNTLRK